MLVFLKLYKKIEIIKKKYALVMKMWRIYDWNVLDDI